MVDERLVNYIKEQILLGKSDEVIKSELAEKGWLMPQIEEAFSFAISSSTNNSPSAIYSKKFSNRKILLGLSLFALLSLIGIFSYFSFFKAKTDSSNKAILDNSRALKVAYTTRSVDGGSNIESVDIETGAKTTIISKSVKDGAIEDLLWSKVKEKIAFNICCGGEDKGIWIMNSDGSVQEKIFQYNQSIQDLQWSPDGTKLSFQYSTGDEETLKILDLNSKQEKSIFDVLTKTSKKGRIDDTFWSFDSKSLFVTVVYEKTQNTSDFAWETMQVSRDGEIIDRFTGKVVGGAIENKIIYAMSTTGNFYPRDIYISNFDGNNQEKFYSVTKDCDPQVSLNSPSWVGIRLSKTVGDKVAFPVGVEPTLCRKIVIINSKTKEIMETGDSITNFDWSPEGDYLATISDLGFQIDLYSGEGTFLKTLSKEDMYENLIFIR